MSKELSLPTNLTLRAQHIRDVIRYIGRFKNAVIVIHINDEVIDSPIFTSHIRDICMLHQVGLKVIIVPGAQKRINEILSSSKKTWSYSQGCRITNDDAMPLIKMAAFDISNRVMTCLAGESQTAVIGNWVRARGKGVLDGIDFGTAGEIDKIQNDSLQTVLDNGFIPIFPCIGWSASWKPYNISSQTLASEVAIKLHSDKLFFLTPNTTINSSNFDIPQNILLSPNGCVPSLNLEELETFLATNVEHTEIIHLLQLAHFACSSGVSRVHLLNGSIDGSIPCEIFSDFGSGTMIYQNNYGGIRDMTIDDIPSVLNLIRPFVEKEILLPRTQESLLQNYSDYIVYELDGGIRACAALHHYSDNQSEIAAVAVDENCSHTGIGPKIIAYMINRAKQEKASCVFVLTTQTADWFEQLGFIPAEISTLPQQRLALWNKKRGSKLLRLSF